MQRIDRAYKLYFGNLKRKVKTAPPGFGKVKKYSSFTLKQAGWQLLGDNSIKIQGTVYKFSKSRDIPPGVKTVTVKRDHLGDLYLYFVIDEEADQSKQTMTGNSAGFDFGAQRAPETFLVTSDGNEIESPLYYRQVMAELKTAPFSPWLKPRAGCRHQRAVVT